MITREQGLMKWASEWRNLRAWRRDLSLVKIEISKRAYPDRLGTCWTREQRIVIYRGPNFVHELGTLLHELAHAATQTDHEWPWQNAFSTAITEVTGIVVVPLAYNHEHLNTIAHNAMATWWRVSGNAALWKLASTTP